MRDWRGGRAGLRKRSGEAGAEAEPRKARWHKVPHPLEIYVDYLVLRADFYLFTGAKAKLCARKSGALCHGKGKLCATKQTAGKHPKKQKAKKIPRKTRGLKCRPLLYKIYFWFADNLWRG